MSYDNPTEIFSKYDSPQKIQKVLDERYAEWWILDRIIELNKSNIYYFKNVYVEQTMQCDVRNNQIVEAIPINNHQ